MNTTTSISPTAQSRTSKFVSWGLRILAALVFLAAGGAKLAGVPMMVEIFEHIGIGQWFRIVTGLIEIIGAIGLLVPAMAGLAGLLLAATMSAAILVHLFVIGGSPVPAIVLLLITATIAWQHRTSVPMLNRLGRG
ncbi:DoxX family protein [Pseudomonas sp. DSP3-2-2]|uniref:DoxX family protein n=1 Tax=unclassified Pseudomonas TaxID=196821 RepID=UPI003CF95361